MKKLNTEVTSDAGAFYHAIKPDDFVSVANPVDVPGVLHLCCHPLAKLFLFKFSTACITIAAFIMHRSAL